MYTTSVKQIGCTLGDKGEKEGNEVGSDEVVCLAFNFSYTM